MLKLKVISFENLQQLPTDFNEIGANLKLCTYIEHRFFSKLIFLIFFKIATGLLHFFILWRHVRAWLR